MEPKSFLLKEDFRALAEELGDRERQKRRLVGLFVQLVVFAGVLALVVGAIFSMVLLAACGAGSCS